MKRIVIGVLVVFWAALGIAGHVDAQEMNVKQGNRYIGVGQTHSFGFGIVEVGSSKTVTFTIENTGAAPLELTGSPLIELGGDHPYDFELVSLPATPIAPGESSAFTITLTPRAAGKRSATVSIPNNDADENPYTFTISSALAGDLAWKYRLNYINTFPAIGADGTIYVGTSAQISYLHALNPDGTVKWRSRLEAYGGSSPVIGTDGTLYIHTGSYLYAINLDGIFKWRRNVGSGGTAPAIGTDGTIYVGGYNGNDYIYAFNPAGTLKWRYRTAGHIQSTLAIGADGTIYAGGGLHNLYALNSDGTLKWIYSSLSSYAYHSIIGTDGTIYVRSDTYVYALNTDGTLRWRQEVGDGGAYSPAIGIDGTLYVGNRNSYFYALNRDGAIKWSYSTGYRETAPAIGADGTIYAGGEQAPYLNAFNPDGTLKWHYNTGISSITKISPVLGDNMLYWGSEGYLYAFFTDSGGLAQSAWPMLSHDARHTGQGQKPERPVTPLALETPYEGTLSPWQFNDFSLDVGAGQAVLIRVEPGTGLDSLTLDATFGDLSPYPGTGEYTTTRLTPRNSYELIVFPTEAGTYYFSLFTNEGEKTGSPYTISARVLDQVYLSDINLRSAENTTTFTVAFTGFGFTQDTQVAFNGSELPTITPQKIVVSTPTEMFATFALNGAQSGFYDVQVENPNESPSVLEGAFKIGSSTSDQLRVEIEIPPGVRPSRTYTCWLEYENQSDSAISAPFFVISNDSDAPMRLSNNEPFEYKPLQVLGISLNGPAGTLLPGEVHRIPIYFTVPPQLPSHHFIEFSIEVVSMERMTADDTPIDWDEIEAEVRPADIDDTAWNAIWSNFKTQLGDTWTEYLQRLNDNATYSSLYRQSVEGSLVAGELSLEDFEDISSYDVGALLEFEFAKAAATSISPRAMLASAQDSSIPAPAQEVFVTDPLDTDLDWSSFQFGEVVFGDQVVSALAGRQSGQKRIVLDDMAVDIIANFDATNGVVSWTLRTLDLETGELPQDAYAGFLPPNDDTGRGEGYVTFRIRTRSDLSPGTVIPNAASIVFDTEAPIPTNEVFNTIGTPLPEPPSDPNISDGALDVSTLSWAVSDYADSYSLYLWEQGQLKPEDFTITDLDLPTYDPVVDLDYGTTYLWLVIAENIMGVSEGVLWSFTTENLGYDLTVNTSGTGSGAVSSSPPGITCGTDCTERYDTDTEVTLTADPDVDSIFDGWSGACDGTEACVVVMNTDAAVTAAFTLKTYTITATAGAGGQIAPEGSVIVNHGADQTFTILLRFRVIFVTQREPEFQEWR